MAKAMPKIEPQQDFEEVEIQNNQLLKALEAREERKEAVSEHRKATDRIKEIVANMEEHVGKKVRCGRFTFEVVREEGGIQRSGFVTKGGVKAKKIKAGPLL